MRALQPEGLHCAQGHKLPDDQAPHDRKRAPLVKYRCRQCGTVYNILSGTVWSGTHLDCCVIVLLWRGFAKGVASQALADELELSYKTVLTWRHRLQAAAVTKSETKVIDDEEAEGDELFQNAGERARSMRTQMTHRDNGAIPDEAAGRMSKTALWSPVSSAVKVVSCT